MNTLKEIVNSALVRIAENPAEFLCPGITLYKQDHQVLKDLYEHLMDRFERHKIPIPEGVHRIGRRLKFMEHQIKEGEQGYTIVYENTDAILDSMALYDNYWFYKF